jgi:hypothetical protein
MRRKRKPPAGLGQGAGKLVHHSPAVNDPRLPQITRPGKPFGFAEYESVEAVLAYRASPTWGAASPKGGRS